MTGRSRARDRSRPSGGAPLWTPSQLAPTAWLRADMGVTLVTSAVAAWADQSGNAKNFSQGTAPNRMSFTASDAAFGNQPVIVGTGSGWLDATSAWNLSQPSTVLIVGTSGTFFDWRTFFDCSAGWRSAVRADPSNVLASYAGTANITSSSVASPSSFAVVLNGASSVHYLNNVSSSGAGDPGTVGIGTPTIGAGPAGIYPTQSVSKIAELVVVNRALTATEIRQWFTYTRARYGLAVTGL